MNTKKVLLRIMLIICFASIVASVIVYSQIPRSGEERHIFVMKSGSMIPTVMKESFVEVDKTVRASEIDAAPAPDGDIIVFYNPRKGFLDPSDIIMHRAISKSYDAGEDKWEFKTQGDANPVPDTWDVPEDYLIGKVVNLNLTPTLLLGSVLFLASIAIAIVTGVLSLVLFILNRKKKKVRPDRADYVV